MTTQLVFEPPVHPGVMFKRWMRAHKVKTITTAENLGFCRHTIMRLTSGETPLTLTMAFRLEAATGIAADDWLLMQMRYDLYQARQNGLDRTECERVVPLIERAA